MTEENLPQWYIRLETPEGTKFGVIISAVTRTSAILKVKDLYPTASILEGLDNHEKPNLEDSV